MSKMGDELILELAASLGGLNKTAAKDDDDKKDDKKDEKEDKKDEKEDKKDDDDKKDDKKDDDKDDKDDKKKEAVMYVLNGLSKLAGELEDLGAEEASNLVDDALQVIVNNVKKK